jgi:hypothetical protein
LTATGAVPVIAGATYADTRKSMPTSYPRDRFDDIPQDLARVGAHRAPVPPRRGLVVLAWAALATGVIVTAGVLGLNAIESRVSATGTTAVTSAAPVPTVDPQIDVVVLNATSTTGLAKSASTMLKQAGWKVGSLANANSTSVTQTTVYYAKSGDAGAAAGLAKSLGVTRTLQSERFAVPGQDRLTVVLGADYAAKH